MKQTKRVLDDRLRRLERKPTGSGGGGGTTDHGALTGLADDDHTQYHTDARGDARYSALGHTHTGTYEPAGTVDSHESAVDPHTQYLTQAEGDASYAVLGHTHPGATFIAGTATVTVPYPGRFEWEETIVATGVTSSQKAFVVLGQHSDSDENHEAGLNVLSMGAATATDALIISMAFGERTAGPIKLNYMVV